MSIKFLAGLIVTIMVFIVMLFAIYEITNLLKGDTPIQTCRLSVIKASKVSEYSSLYDKIKKASYANCPRVDSGTIDKKKKLTKQELSKLLYDEMGDCWYKFGEGQFNPNPGDQFEQGIRCYICSSFKTNNDYSDVQNDLSEYFEVFPKKKEYLEKAFISSKSKKPIYEVKSVNSKTALFSNLITKENMMDYATALNIKKDTPYYLVNMFTIDKDGIFFKEFEVKSKMAFIKAENIPKVCYSLEN